MSLAPTYPATNPRSCSDIRERRIGAAPLPTCSFSLIRSREHSDLAGINAGCCRGFLDARKNYPDSTLADLYDPLTMPPDLRKAHDAVDRFVDRLYRKAPFTTDADRVALLFKRYQELTSSTA